MISSDLRSPTPARESAPSSALPAAPPSVPTEVELKLLADPDDLARLMDSPLIQALARNKGRVRHLTSVYYDSAEGRLAEAGVAFRIRKLGRHFVATAKREQARDARPLARDEWEAPVAGLTGDPSPLLPQLPDDLQALFETVALEPVFRTIVRRHTQRLSVSGSDLEIAFDRGVIEADARSAPICEIEIELKRGDPATLFEVAARLAEIAPLRPSLHSKAERGAALARNLPLPSHRAPRLRLEAGLSLDDALSAILRSIFGHLLANQAAAEELRDPEGVHQMRVALRRLRAALALIAPLAPSPALETLRADARRLASALGPARNWDLFLLELLPAITNAAPTLVGLTELAEAAVARRAAAHQNAGEALAAQRTGRFAISLGAWVENRGWRTDAGAQTLETLDAPALAFAGPLLARRHRRVIRRGRHFARLSSPARHALRLAVKKLRYSVDFFLSLEAGGKSSRRFVRRLGRLQELLGTFNDMTTTPERTAELAASALSPGAQSALGAVIGWQARGLVDLEPELRAAWRAFRRAETPWSARPSPAIAPSP